jgi:hypothetical protein
MPAARPPRRALSQRRLRRGGPRQPDRRVAAHRRSPSRRRVTLSTPRGHRRRARLPREPRSHFERALLRDLHQPADRSSEHTLPYAMAPRPRHRGRDHASDAGTDADASHRLHGGQLDRGQRGAGAAPEQRSRALHRCSSHAPRWTHRARRGAPLSARRGQETHTPHRGGRERRCGCRSARLRRERRCAGLRRAPQLGQRDPGRALGQ